ncbi:MAG: protein phosphatase 2A structural subunit, partial [Marteilia pararefringens]
MSSIGSIIQGGHNKANDASTSSCKSPSSIDRNKEVRYETAENIVNSTKINRASSVESNSGTRQRSENTPKEHKLREATFDEYSDFSSIAKVAAGQTGGQHFSAATVDTQANKLQSEENNSSALGYTADNSTIIDEISHNILSTDISPMELFVEDMKSDNIEIRLSAINNLKSIANALGPSKTESELIPFIARNIQDEDEIFFSLANQLVSLVNCIPNQRNPICLKSLFDVLMSIEEGCVRNKAIESFKEIVEKLDQAVIEEYFYPIVIEMADVIWFPKKISACQLIAFLFPLVSNSKKMGLFKSFTSLLSAEMPLVRRNAVVHLSQIATQFYNSDVPIPEALTKEYQSLKDSIT